MYKILSRPTQNNFVTEFICDTEEDLPIIVASELGIRWGSTCYVAASKTLYVLDSSLQWVKSLE